MGMIIVWGWDLVFYYLFVDSAGSDVSICILCTTLRSNSVIYMINIKELQLPNLPYVGRHLDKRTRYLFASFMDVKSFGFILHTCAPK